MAALIQPIEPRGRSALSLEDIGRGMVVRHLSVAAPDVVFVKGILEASEGIAGIFADRGGELSIIAPLGREAELAELLEDLARDVSAILQPTQVEGER